MKSDRLRTTVNVWGDSIGAGIVDHLSRNEIKQLELENGKGEGEYEPVNTDDADFKTYN